MKYFQTINAWDIPESALIESCREMANDGKNGDEGTVLWLGNRTNSRAIITHLVFLRGSGIIKRPDLLTIQPWLLNEVTDLTIELNNSLIGQIHSHGRFYGTDLSQTDRTYGFAIPHFLSIVAPDYAAREDTGILDCGVHVFETGAGYRRLGSDEIMRKITVFPGPSLPILIVGE